MFPSSSTASGLLDETVGESKLAESQRRRGPRASEPRNKEVVVKKTGTRNQLLVPQPR